MWMTKCPKCGTEDNLWVVRGTFSGSIPLSEDGFAFVDARCVDTEDEVVRCGACGAEFALSDLDADAEERAFGASGIRSCRGENSK